MSFIGQGLTIYIAGASYKNPQKEVYGAGVYWYRFTNEVSPLKHFPMADVVPTSNGFVYKKTAKIEPFPLVNNVDEFIQHVREDEHCYAVHPTRLFEYAKGVCDVQSKLRGEVFALLKAFQVINESLCDYSTIYMESELMLRIFNQVRQYDKPDSLKIRSGQRAGFEIPNSDVWSEIQNVLKNIHANKLQFCLKIIKGSGDSDKSNTNTDINLLLGGKMAALGVSIANSLSYGVYPNNTLDGVYEIENTLESLKADKNPTTIHPLLVNKRVYYNFGGRQDKHWFYVGNTGHQVDDIYIGRVTPDAQIGIVYLSEQDPVVNMLEEVQEKWLVQHYGYQNLMYCLNMGDIALANNYRLLSKYGEACIQRPNGVPNLTTYSGKLLTYVNDPVYLAGKNISRLEELNNVLSTYRQVDSVKTLHQLNIHSYDITHLFYQTDKMNVVEDLKGQSGEKVVGKSLLGEFKTDTKFVKAKIDFVFDDNCVVNKEIILTCGIDMPRRNQLKTMENEFPSVELLVWRNGGGLFFYSVLIQLHEKGNDGRLVLKNFGIFKGVSSSQILVDARTFDKP